MGPSESTTSMIWTASCRQCVTTNQSEVNRIGYASAKTAFVPKTTAAMSMLTRTATAVNGSQPEPQTATRPPPARSHRVALDHAAPEVKDVARRAATAIVVIVAAAMMSVLLIPRNKKTWHAILDTGTRSSLTLSSM